MTSPEFDALRVEIEAECGRVMHELLDLRSRLYDLQARVHAATSVPEGPPLSPREAMQWERNVESLHGRQAAEALIKGRVEEEEEAKRKAIAEEEAADRKLRDDAVEKYRSEASLREAAIIEARRVVEGDGNLLGEPQAIFSGTNRTARPNTAYKGWVHDATPPASAPGDEVEEPSAEEVASTLEMTPEERKSYEDMRAKVEREKGVADEEEEESENAA